MCVDECVDVLRGKKEYRKHSYISLNLESSEVIMLIQFNPVNQTMATNLGELLTNILNASTRTFGLNKYLQRLTLIFFHCLSSSSSAYLFRSASFSK